jgi:hypothetical protein
MSRRGQLATGANATSVAKPASVTVQMPASQPPSRQSSPVRRPSLLSNAKGKKPRGKKSPNEEKEGEEEEEGEGERASGVNEESIHTIPDWAEELRNEIAGGNPSLENIMRLIPCLLDNWAAERGSLAVERKSMAEERKRFLSIQNETEQRLKTLEKGLNHLQREAVSAKNRHTKNDLRSTDNCLLIRGVPARSPNERKEITMGTIGEILADLKVENEVKVTSAERLVSKKGGESARDGKNAPLAANAGNENAPTIRIKLQDAAMKYVLYKALPKWNRPRDLQKFRVQQEYPQSMRGANDKLEKIAYDLRQAGFKTRIQLKGVNLELLKKGKSDAEFQIHEVE